MNLIDALEILKRPASEIPTGTMFLACGFTPLHLKTLLEAELRLRLPQKRWRLETGLFGDLIGNVERLDPSHFEGLIAVVEWADLDPRLGIRSLGGWRPSLLPEIVASAEKSAARLLAALKQSAKLAPAVVCPPTLPLPPLFFTLPSHASTLALRLDEMVASLTVSLSEQAGIRVLSSQAVNELSPLARRFDVKSELLAGFPYALEHASALAAQLAQLTAAPQPKKGVISDLDDTLWDGLLGEDGVDGISWNLEHKTQLHGLYQQFLASLAGAGVLIAAASKNDPALVDAAFHREDLLISRDEIFPLEIRWSQKSESVRRVLAAWNVGADSVVFVDDSPLELAEVRNAFPEMECLLFPKGDCQGVWELLKRLRELFGKSVVNDEDALRLESLRTGSQWHDSMRSPDASVDEFLRAAEASITFKLTEDAGDARAFELVNKTNQFNLNGQRFGVAEWREFFADPRTFLLTANYQDKFGALGEIAALLGKKLERKLCVEAWVMSCRAFSRRIEHQCLNLLFEEFDVDEIVFHFRGTARNGPLREFMAALLIAPPSDGELALSRETFAARRPALFHQVRKAVHV